MNVVKYYKLDVGENDINFQIYVDQLENVPCTLMFMLSKDAYPTPTTADCIANETQIDYNFNYVVALQAGGICKTTPTINGTWYIGVQLVSNCSNVPISVENILEEKPPQTIAPPNSVSSAVSIGHVNVGVIVAIMMWMMLR